MATNSPGQYWVTWPHTSNTTAAEAGAIIWGPQATAPVQLTGFFLAGPFSTKAEAQAYKSNIGKNTLPGLSSLPGVSTLNTLSDLGARLTDKHTWIRVGEAIVALILLDIGLKSLTGTSIVEKTSSGVKKGALTAAKVVK